MLLQTMAMRTDKRDHLSALKNYIYVTFVPQITFKTHVIELKVVLLLHKTSLCICTLVK